MRSKPCTVIGLLLLAAALLLAAYNLRRDTEAKNSAEAVAETLAAQLVEVKTAAVAETETVYTPDYILNSEMDMPETAVDGQWYIGVLRIPALSLELPVISEWSYPSLKLAPCRYAGSVYLNNMVIAAHNYTSHFGRLRELSQGDEVSFTDMDGNVFRYEVAALETLSPFANEEMTGGDWPLTLFTCTVGGQSRVTVRCELTEDGN